jgi:ATP-dependent DNA helicase RecG
MNKMLLPINAKRLIEEHLIESERIELKEGFNPESIVHTMCAFANDFNNWGGGYIIIGVDDKKRIIGIAENQIDFILKKIVELSNKIQWPYYPIVEPTKYNSKNLIILYCPGGPARPYKAPKSFGVASEYKYYIRHSSSTVVANKEEEKELIGMSNQIPYDDQINQKASLNDLNVELIKSYLQNIHSGLSAKALSFEELCKSLNIIEGPNEMMKPKNVGLLFFSNEPEKYIKTPWIEVTIFQDKIGDKFREERFSGPLQNQIISALQYIKNSAIQEQVIKVPTKAEAIRFFSYPYTAIEEALVNAVYHKSYEIDAPIEVRIELDRIDIISYPGPLPPLNKDNINDAIVISKRYRNRRIGDFLKELKLTEGKNTGFRKIRSAMQNNGSPAPVFITDDDRVQFITRLKIHPKFEPLNEPISEPISEPIKSETIFHFIELNPNCKRADIEQDTKMPLGTLKRYLQELIHQGRITKVGSKKTGGYVVIQRGRLKHRGRVRK